MSRTVTPDTGRPLWSVTHTSHAGQLSDFTGMKATPTVIAAIIQSVLRTNISLEVECLDQLHKVVVTNVFLKR